MSLARVFSKGGQAQQVFGKGLRTVGNILSKGANFGSSALNFANKTGLTAAASQIPDVGPAIAAGASQAPAYLNAASVAGSALSNAGNALSR